MRLASHLLLGMSPLNFEEALPTAFDLIFNMKEAPTNLTGTVTVKDGTFDGNNVANVSDELTQILEIMVSEPNGLISKSSGILGVERCFRL